jgi:glycosyltransferase involved in cell wall biosynthesis
VPGGGVRADEHGDPSADRRFREVYPRTIPFFLVLGRKTASKGYEQAICAHQALRAAGTKADLVLIGPDEDGRPVSGEGVTYLGRQPREVIRGALGACLGLVTMSRSESFGIVLCEAWLFGKPVIANNACYSFRELVRHGETGLLATTDAEVTEAMRRLAEERDERERMGRAGFEEVVRKYTWDGVTAALLQDDIFKYSDAVK